MNNEADDWLKKPMVDDGMLFIDPSRFYVSCRGQELKLTSTEFKILYILASAGGKIVTRKTMVSDITQNEYFMNEATVRVHISKLREKLPEKSIILKPIVAIGYRYIQINESSK